jgi:hypothetical protein
MESTMQNFPKPIGATKVACDETENHNIDGEAVVVVEMTSARTVSTTAQDSGLGQWVLW